MSKVYFLPVGEADCFVLTLDTPEGQRNVLLDGGSLKDRRIDLADWLHGHDIHTIDLMILTHLHEDHQGALPEVAATFPVRRAVVPVPPFGISEKQVLAEVDGELKDRRRDLWEYDQMYHALEAQGTVLSTFYPMDELPVFRFGDYTLSCLFPLPGARSQVRDGLGDLTGLPANEINVRRKAVEKRINEESAVFLLERVQEQLVLFSGDCQACSIDEAMARRPMHPRVVKLSHHGRNSETHTYYTPAQIRTLAPETVVVTYAPFKSPDRHEEWAAIDPRARLVVTCDDPDGYILEI